MALGAFLLPLGMMFIVLMSVRISPRQPLTVADIIAMFALVLKRCQCSAFGGAHVMHRHSGQRTPCLKAKRLPALG